MEARGEERKIGRQAATLAMFDDVRNRFKTRLVAGAGKGREKSSAQSLQLQLTGEQRESLRSFTVSQSPRGVAGHEIGDDDRERREIITLLF